MKRPQILLLLLLSLTLLSLPASAVTRLPEEVTPRNYALTITPDLVAETFGGEERIDVDVANGVDRITLHSVELTISEAIVESNGKSIVATVVADVPNETITLKLPVGIAAGPAAIRFRFEGRLLPQLRGLYLSKTARRKYAVTQFEAMSARRAFPCFDEPAMKATFDITLVVDSGDTAISNGPILSDTPAGAGKHALRFGKTRKISTYLVALLVGDFECISGSAEGVPIRVCSTPGLQSLGAFALEAARQSVTFFNHYYGIVYPFEKLDLIGIPDFAAGAMENAGAVTFRETDLLVDEKSSSIIARKRVAEVVAHELAHQWFGDLVTMKWWDDIWLNEGFATFMSEKPLEAWKPEWRTDLEKPGLTDDALLIDSALSTSPIRSPATAEGGGALSNPGIIYGKTASILRMVEEWVGPEAFRDSIRLFLKKYAWSNAAAEEFWASMKSSSKQPIDEVLRLYTDQPGAPLLRFEGPCRKGQRSIRQERLTNRGVAVPAALANTIWSVPICARRVGSKSSEQCHMLTSRKETLRFQSPCSEPLFLSRAGAGYFTVDYPRPERRRLRTALAKMTAADRISYHGNEWLLVRAMRRNVDEYLSLLSSMPRPVERPLITAMVANLIYLDQRLVDEGKRGEWLKLVQKTLQGQAFHTWKTPVGETPGDTLARGAVLWALGYAGDMSVVEGARETAASYMDDPSAVDPVIAESALRLAASYGDGAFLDRVLDQLTRAATPEVAARYRNLLPLFREEKVKARAIEYIYSDQIRTQDLPLVASAILNNPATRTAGWSAARSQWADLEKRAPGSLNRIALGTSSFCDSSSRKEVESFFTEHPLRGGPNVLSRILESIDSCIAFRIAQAPAFARALRGSRVDR